MVETGNEDGLESELNKLGQKKVTANKETIRKIMFDLLFALCLTCLLESWDYRPNSFSEDVHAIATDS